MAHHPEKFLDGHMLWRGRIYSPLPFVRSLWGTRINAGVWGTAAFPSVYRTDVHPFAFLPHSIRWQVLSFVLDARPALGVAATRRHHVGRRRCCSAAGIVGLAVDDREEHRVRAAIRRRLAARQPALVPRDGRVPALHPAARAPPRPDPRRAVAAGGGAAAGASRRRAAARGRRSREAWRALLLISGSVTEDRFWSETWTSADRVLVAAHRLAAPIARGRARSRSTKAGRTIATSACSSAAGRGSTSARSSRSTAAASRSLRVSTHLRPDDASASSARCRLGAGAARRGAARGVALRWPLGWRDRARRLDAGDHRLRGLAHGADDGDRAPRHRARRRSARAWRAMPSGPARVAAHRAVAAAHVRPAQRDHLRRDDRRARRGHVHAARGGDRRRSSAARKGYAGDNGPPMSGLARHAGRHRRRAERRHLLRRLEQRRHPPHRRAATATSSRSPATTSSAPASPATTARRIAGAARHAGRRRDRARRRSDRRRLAQRSHPPRRPADRASSRRSPAPARTATTATTSRRPRRRSTRRARWPSRRTATSTSPTR